MMARFVGAALIILLALILLALPWRGYEFAPWIIDAVGRITTRLSLPPALHATILTAAVTLFAVWVTNLSSEKRHRDQINHDASHREKDRLTKLRTNEYLNFVEANSMVANFMPRAAEFDVGSPEFAKPIQSFVVAANKASLVAEPKTAVLITEHLAEVMKLHIRFLPVLLPITNLRTHMNLEIQPMLDTLKADLKRTHSERMALIESGHVDEMRMRALNNSYDFAATEQKNIWKSTLR